MKVLNNSRLGWQHNVVQAIKYIYPVIHLFWHITFQVSFDFTGKIIKVTLKKLKKKKLILFLVRSRTLETPPILTSTHMIWIVIDWDWPASGSLFNGMLTFVGYLMSNSSLQKDSSDTI